MKIAVFHNLPAGGAKRVLYEEIKYLSAFNQLDLFTFYSTDDEFLSISPYFKKIYKFFFNLPLSKNFKRLQEDLDILFRLEKTHEKIAAKINAGSYDAVLVHPDKYTQAPFLLKHLKIPSLYYCHEWLRIVYEKELKFHGNVSPIKAAYERISRKVKKKIDRVNAKKATKIATNSEYTKKNIRDAYGRNSTVIYPGVDTKIFRRTEKKINQIIFVGEPAEINGYELLSSAYNLLINIKKPTIKVIQASKIKNISDDVLSKEYSKSLIAMCLSYNEPFGLSVIESMACGTPVIALDEGGYKETIEDGKTGYLIRRSPEELAEKIKMLLNPITNKKFSLNAHSYAIDNWGWEKHNKKLSALLLSMVDKDEKN